MKHPVQKLAYGNGDALFLAIGARVQEFDAATGALRRQWQPEEPAAPVADNDPPRKKAKVEASPATNAFRSLCCSPNGKYIIGSTDEQKLLLVFSTENLTLVSARKFPKRPSAIAITEDSTTIFLGDKFGDVYSVPLIDNGDISSSANGFSKTTTSETESGSELEPIFGHVSMLVDVIVVESAGVRHIISSDRDEHVRVTQYPKSYIIERFCFGHEQFVSQLVIPAWSPNTLISGGGDDFIAHWDWTNGQLIEKIEIKSKLIFPPSTAEDDDEKKLENEVAILGIWPVPELHVILAYDQSTSTLLIFKLDDGKLEYLSQVSISILDIALTGIDGEIFVSLDNRSEATPESLIKKFKITAAGQISEIDSEIMSKISAAASYELVSPIELAWLQPISVLRKRAEH
ncbi:uncharacterized protein V1518DRAFT_410683 [Limtongia smithiae]|uniref:uncharacterized protein n=1 Tax=Limtongia smithiae TaxID=1125753 RepID=UPI0034CFF2D2